MYSALLEVKKKRTQAESQCSFNKYTSTQCLGLVIIIMNKQTNK